MFQVLFTYQRSQVQTARYDVQPTREVLVDSEAEALKLLASPPKGAKAGMVRELNPIRFVKTRRYR